MNYTEREMQSLKEQISEMWRLVLSQLEKAKQSYMNGDIELAREIISREKRVDAFELKIDSDCENFIALYSPVAVDLRLALSIIKLGRTLERIADFARGIARHVINDECHKLDPQLIEELQIEKMFDTVISMLSDGYVALESENTKIAGRILAKDEAVDKIYRKSFEILTAYLQEHTAHIPCGLKTIMLIRKLERIGDHCGNLVEEIVFYVDAKVLKHRGKKKKQVEII
jgi:phosphate transport system protein